jgi:N-acetylneuraminic acid mutarotase
MPTPRSHLAVGVVNGVLYAVGGISGGTVLGVVEAYEPCSNTWTLKAAMPTPRTGLAVGVVNGQLYAVGGVDGASNVLQTVEAYQPSTNSWAARAPMLTPSCNLAADAVNGTLYAIGGQFALTEMAVVQAYNPATNTWINRAPMPTARENLVAGVVDGILYAIGGWNSAQIGQPELHTIEAYDPATNNWTTKAPMTTARRNLAAGVVNGAIVCVGGYVGTMSMATNEAYRP